MGNASKYNLKGIILSNSDYGSGIGRLEGAVNSARLLQRELGDGVTLWTNKTSLMAKEKINEYLSHEKFSDRDVFLFYFCGHGDMVGKAYNELLLECADTSESNYTAEVGIKYEWLLDIIKQRVATRYVIVLDCCKSGLVSAMGTGKIWRDGYSLGTGAHAALITSTSTVEASIEMRINGKLYAAFTYFLAQSLKEGIVGKGEYIRLKDLFLEVYRKISEHNSNPDLPHLPVPQIKNVGFMEQACLFRNPAGRQREVIRQERDNIKKSMKEWKCDDRYSVKGGFRDLYDHSEYDSNKSHLLKGGFNDILKKREK